LPLSISFATEYRLPTNIHAPVFSSKLSEEARENTLVDDIRNSFRQPISLVQNVLPNEEKRKRGKGRPTLFSLLVS
ncbi:MAG: hypothetical protein O7D30_01455, partial [Rickettsia endosymbiont of Ixodes persulcatus]|nr:hypothetical protein [Rickettsia endosymbiont of Ixodes persulcatus]